MRLLITGSRRWTDAKPIIQAISALHAEACVLGQDLTVIHGKAPGADSIAGGFVRMAIRQGWAAIAEDPHPANWSAACIDRCAANHRRRRSDGTDYCPAEGMYRNERMVALLDPAADSCFAFIRDDSPGATGCVRIAERAGIHVTVMRWDERR